MHSRIQAHQAQLLRSPADFFPPCCPACLETDVFRVHELRPRGFWFVVSHTVRRARSFVLRVICKLCGCRTTVLPDFALPHKRYVLTDVIDSSERYLLDENATYRSAAQVDGRPAFHNSEGSSRAPSTVHRWVGFLGSLVTLLAHATSLVLESDPAFSPLAEMLDFSPRRTRTTTRNEQLGNAHRLLRVRARFEQTISHGFFPRIATAAAWT